VGLQSIICSQSRREGGGKGHTLCRNSIIGPQLVQVKLSRGWPLLLSHRITMLATGREKWGPSQGRSVGEKRKRKAKAETVDSLEMLKWTGGLSVGGSLMQTNTGQSTHEFTQSHQYEMEKVRLDRHPSEPRILARKVEPTFTIILRAPSLQSLLLPCSYGTSDDNFLATAQTLSRSL